MTASLTGTKRFGITPKIPKSTHFVITVYGKLGTTEKAAGGKSATREMQNGGATLKQ